MEFRKPFSIPAGVEIKEEPIKDGKKITAYSVHNEVISKTEDVVDLQPWYFADIVLLQVNKLRRRAKAIELGKKILELQE